MEAPGRLETRDPKIIPIGPWLRPSLVVDTSPPDSKVIPIRPRRFPRLERRRPTPPLQMWLAGICWIAAALL